MTTIVTFNGNSYTLPDDFQGNEYAAVWEAYFSDVAEHVAGLVAGTLSASDIWAALEQSSAVDITLTAASPHLQSITMTAAAKAVILPDATTLVEGRPWMIHNAGATNSFAVKKNGGAELVAAVAPGETYRVAVLDNATAAGSWHSVQLDAPAPAAAGVTCYEFEDATDITLTNKISAGASGVYDFSSTQSVTFPANGLVCLVWTGRVDTYNSYFTFGIQTGGTEYWSTYDANGTVGYTHLYQGVTGYKTWTHPKSSGDLNLGIEEGGIPDGEQTVQIVVGRETGAAVPILKGTVTTSRIRLLVFDFD